MDTNDRVICEILGFKVTCFTIQQDDGQLLDSCFAICNSDGEVVSQKYKKIAEPMDLLLKIEKFLEQQIEPQSQFT